MNDSKPHPYRFVLLNGPRKGEIISLQLGETKVGRSSRMNDIVFEDPTVSREHLRMVIADSGVTVEDLGSSHGSSINGVPLTRPSPLNHEDLLQVGEQKLKFERMAPAAASAPASSGVIPPDGTSVMPGGVGGESEGTRFMPVREVEKPNEQYEATRVFEAAGTRMLTPEELEGLKPGVRRGPSSPLRLIAGIALVAALIVAGTFYVVMRSPGVSAWEDGVELFKDPQYSYYLSRPKAWQQETTKSGATVHFAARDAKHAPCGSVDVFVTANADNSLDGLTIGFDNYKAVLTNRHKGFVLLGSKTMTIHEARVVFYAFKSRELQGKAIYTHDGDLQIALECTAPVDRYPSMGEAFTDVLYSFGLVKAQRYIDYPRPDESQRRMAITDSQRIKAEAEQADKLGQDLLRLRGVRPENLYQAVRQFQLALQKSTALGSRPPFFVTSARNLRDALGLYNDSLRDQWFKITAAARQGDNETARLEAARLMMMIPDKRDPDYQDAVDAMQQYSITQE